jgi:hypothetical protein
MNPYTDTMELKKRRMNPKFCIACFRVRKRVKVDEHHVCLDCRTGSISMPRRLRAITLKNGKTYFVDERLRELRNIHDPCDRIDFEDLLLHKMDLLNW